MSWGVQTGSKTVLLLHKYWQSNQMKPADNLQFLLVPAKIHVHSGSPLHLYLPYNMYEVVDGHILMLTVHHFSRGMAK